VFTFRLLIFKVARSHRKTERALYLSLITPKSFKRTTLVSQHNEMRCTADRVYVAVTSDGHGITKLVKSRQSKQQANHQTPNIAIKHRGSAMNSSPVTLTSPRPNEQATLCYFSKFRSY